MSDTYPRKVGELRPTQMMFTYGVGAIVDLPYMSVIVTGIEDWPAELGLSRAIHEDRLLRAVRWEVGQQVQRLLVPPITPDQPGFSNPFDEAERIGVPVAAFPRWMLCPQCRLLAPLSSGLFDVKHDAYHPDRARYVHANCPRSKGAPTVVPARFLVACEDGHLDDFPWVEFVHRGPTECASSLQLIEYGPTGGARDLVVRCRTCKAERRLSEAFGRSGKLSMPRCRGRRPHLRDFDPESCDLQVRAILLGASNLWFPYVMATLAIPTESGRLAQLVQDHWATLGAIVSVQNISLLRTIGQLGDFHGYTDDEIWRAVQQKKSQDENEEFTDPLDLKGPEWEIFSHPGASPNTEDFRLREVTVPKGFETYLERVVLAERLREARALVGFTRIDAPGEFGEMPEAAAAGRRMDISRQPPSWIPATEIRGEGIFIQFSESAIRTWLKPKTIRERDQQFLSSHTRWRKARGIEPPEGNFPGLRYVLLHSFAHSLMRRLVLECGYNAAAVRERIYAQNPEPDKEPQAGILIYTAAPDSEGTLGGLVSLGEPEQLRRHMLAALQDAGLCASDPLCSEHLPSRRGVTLHGAACHACLFAPETSCERGNKYLDRSVLVPTVDRDDLAFFKDLT